MNKKLLTLVFASFTLLLSVSGHADTPLDALSTWSKGKWTPDFAAAKRLIENGADVNATASSPRNQFATDETALHVILDEINLRSSSYQDMPGFYQDALEVLDLLVKNGADVNAKTGGGYETTPLMKMNFPKYSRAGTEQIEFVVEALDLMVTNGADINAINYPWGNEIEGSILQKAIFDNNAPIKVIEEIVAHGADINLRRGGRGRTTLEDIELQVSDGRDNAEYLTYLKAILAVLNNADELRARKQAQLAGGGSSSGGGSSTQTEEAKADATPLYSCVSPEEADSKQDKLPTDSKVQYFPPDLGKDLCYNCNQEDLDKWNKPDCALFGFNDLESSVYNNCDAPLVVGWCNRENRGDEKCETLDWSYTLEHEDRLQVNHFNFDEDGTVLFAFCYAPQRPKVNP